jgi:hypothetical protein
MSEGGELLCLLLFFTLLRQQVGLLHVLVEGGRPGL